MEVGRMLEKDIDNNREQSLLLVVIFILAAFIVSGLAIMQMNFEYFHIPRAMADFHEWLYWKHTPGL